jgi:hypothetical protein
MNIDGQARNKYSNLENSVVYDCGAHSKCSCKFLDSRTQFDQSVLGGSCMMCNNTYKKTGGEKSKWNSYMYIGVNPRV